MYLVTYSKKFFKHSRTISRKHIFSDLHMAQMCAKILAEELKQDISTDCAGVQITIQEVDATIEQLIEGKEI